MISWKLAARQLGLYRKMNDVRSYCAIRELMVLGLARQEKRIYTLIERQSGISTPEMVRALRLPLNHLGATCDRLLRLGLIAKSYAPGRICKWKVR